MQQNAHSLFFLMQLFLRAMRAKVHHASDRIRHASLHEGETSSAFGFGSAKREMTGFRKRHANVFRALMQSGSARVAWSYDAPAPELAKVAEKSCRLLGAMTTAQLENIDAGVPEVYTAKMLAERKKEMYFARFRKDPQYRYDWRSTAQGDEVRVAALTGRFADVGEWVAVKDIRFSEKSNRWCMSW